MFRAIRLKLIAYVAAVLATVLLAAGALVYVLLTRQFDAALDTQLRSHLPPSAAPVMAVAAPISGQDSLLALGPGDAPQGCTISTAQPAISMSCAAAASITSAPPAADGVTPGDPGTNVFAVSTGFVAGQPDDGTFVSQSLGGRLISSRALPSGLPDLAGIAAARPGHDDERTVRVGGQRYRLITRVAPALPAGSFPGPELTAQAGISLANRDREERTVVLALAGGGLLGLLLTVAGGLFLTSRAVAPLQLAFERQRRFVADASHELRTPLALVRLEAEDLARRTTSANETRPLLRQVGRVSELVDKLLTLAQLDQGTLQVEPEPVHVATVLDEIARAAGRLSAPGVQVNASAPDDLWVIADRDRLHQILLILVDNACRATPAGGRIDLSARAERAVVVLNVADTGEGIPSAALRTVFERFQRVDAARSRSRGGAGLGLSIARELAEAQHGSVELSSAPGAGTTAIVKLPLAAVPAVPSPELESACR